MHEVYRIVDRCPQLELNRYQAILEKNGIHWSKNEMEAADVSDWNEQGVMAATLKQQVMASLPRKEGGES